MIATLVTLAMVAVIVAVVVADALTPTTKPSVSVRAEAPASEPTLHNVLIRKPAGPPRIKTGVVNALGEPVSIACVTCHATQPPQATLRSSAELDKFHTGLTYKHGELTCLSCHNKDDYNALRFADGASLGFEEVMKLCAQCHGPQYRDYQHGAHGGMTGHWDLSRGDRLRNNCIDCHDPHAPRYSAVKPVFPPNNRRPLHDPRAVRESDHKASTHE